MRVEVCAVEALPPGTARTVRAEGREIVVFNSDGAFVALDNSCAHKGLPLDEGVVRDGVVTCPAHLWRYDVATGKRVDSPGWSVASHRVSVEGQLVVVELPEPEPELSIREQMLRHAREWKRDE